MDPPASENSDLENKIFYKRIPANEIIWKSHGINKTKIVKSDLKKGYINYL